MCYNSTIVIYKPKEQLHFCLDPIQGFLFHRNFFIANRFQFRRTWNSKAMFLGVFSKKQATPQVENVVYF